MKLYRHKTRVAYPLILLTSVLVLIIIGMSFSKMIARKQSKNGQEVLTSAIDQAIVTCYAIEGRYPESLEYLEEHYGITIDSKQYYVSYSVFASNQKPTFKVSLRGTNK